IDSAKGRTEHQIAGTAVRLMVHETMNQREHRKARVDGRVADRGPATIGVPADDLAGEAYAAQGLRTRGEPHPGRRHLEDAGAAPRVHPLPPPHDTPHPL